MDDNKGLGGVLLDTCAAIWLSEGEVLSDEFMAYLNVGAPIFVSPFTAWEISMLVSRKRIDAVVDPMVWYRALINLKGVTVAELSPEILMLSNALPDQPPPDPADRIMIATAINYDLMLATRDKKILQYADRGHLNVLFC